MSTIGKVLVLLHGAVAITVLAWAIGVAANRIHWNTPPAGGKDTGPGLYDRQKAQAAEYNVAVDRSYTRWTGNLNQVLVLEAERYPRRAFYATHLYVMQTGELGGQPVPNPVQGVLAPGPSGFLNVQRNAQGGLDMVRTLAFPPFEVRPGVPARSVAQYDREMKKFVEDIQASQVRSAAAIVEREKLNREIVGVTQPMLVKGLRTLITEQKNIIDQADAEDRYVAVFVTNREAEFGLFKKRKDAMQGRVAELNKYYDTEKKR
jgi:hypothetical protein